MSSPLYVVFEVNAGRLGRGRADLLHNMKIMVNIEGRSLANSSTHKSPIWMHLNTSSSGYDFSSDKSIISKTLSSSHRFQT